MPRLRKTTVYLLFIAITLVLLPLLIFRASPFKIYTIFLQVGYHKTLALFSRDSPREKYRIAEKNINEGDYSSAIKNLEDYYRYCFSADYVNSAGVRGSFALTVVQKLLSQSQDAQLYVDEICDKITKRLYSKNMDGIDLDPKYLNFWSKEGNQTIQTEIKMAALFDYLCLFNKARNKEDNSIEVFEYLESQITNKEVCELCWRHIKITAFHKKKYDLIKKYVTDLRQELEREKKWHSAIVHNPKLISPEGKETLKHCNKASYIFMLLDFGIATNQKKTICEFLDEIKQNEDFIFEDFVKYTEHQDSH